MKHSFFTLLALCITSCSLVLQPALAEAPRPTLLDFTLAETNIGLGEPIIVKYKFTNSEDRRVNIHMGETESSWLTMHLSSASGQSIQPLPGGKLTRGGLFTTGTAVEPNGYEEGYIIISRKFQPTAPGKYRLSLSTHLTYTWDDTSGEKTMDNQTFSLPITITARNVQHLHAVAEGLRQTVLHDPKVTNYQFATKALFSMRDPDVLPVWRELATDPSLDPWKAIDVARELARVGSVNAADLLAQMQSTTPERWSQTGYSPLDALESMKQDANPETAQHISRLLTSNGVEPGHIPVGSAN